MGTRARPGQTELTKLSKWERAWDTGSLYHRVQSSREEAGPAWAPRPHLLMRPLWASPPRGWSLCPRGLASARHIIHAQYVDRGTSGMR